ncbi:hypothetical protein ABIB51_004251 [Arthrobacter sp. UYCu712]
MRTAFGYSTGMSVEKPALPDVHVILEHMVQTLATGTERIQQRLADAYAFSRFGAEMTQGDLPPGIHSLQLDLRAALSTVHDAERGSATASGALLTDDQCVIFALRILTAEREMRKLPNENPKRH